MKKTFLIWLFHFATIATSIAQVAEIAQDISPLLISEKIPSIELTSMNGETASLTDIVNERRSILLFYRGGWCPFCNAHLSEVGQLEEEIEELGYQVIAVSPDSPLKLQESKRKTKVNYILYSDGDGTLTKAMGIAFRAPDRYKEKLSDHSDNQNQGFLPVPSLFVVETDGTILFEYISPNYKNRISANLLRSVLKQLNTSRIKGN